MAIVCWSIVALCLMFGLIGCFINKFPGPLLVLIATLVARFGLGIGAVSWLVILVVALLYVASVVINKAVLPKLMAKLHDFSNAASWGCTVGVILGLPFLAVDTNSAPLIILLLILTFMVMPYLFAFIFELIKVKNAGVAVKAAGSAYAVYAASTIVKLLAFVYAVYAIFNV